MQSRWQYIRSKFQYNTFPQTVLDGLKMIGLRIETFYVFRERLDPTAEQPAPQKPEGFEFGLASRGHLPEMSAYPDKVETLTTLNQRLGRGDLCLVAWQHGKLAAYSWANLREFGFVSYVFPLNDNEAYLFDAYTALEFRGRGMAPYLRYHLYQILAERGRYVLYSASRRHNPGAIQFKMKLGAQIVDSATDIDFFGLWKIRAKSHPDKVRAAASPLMASA